MYFCELVSYSLHILVYEEPDTPTLTAVQETSYASATLMWSPPARSIQPALIGYKIFLSTSATGSVVGVVF